MTAEYPPASGQTSRSPDSYDKTFDLEEHIVKTAVAGGCGDRGKILTNLQNLAPSKEKTGGSLLLGPQPPSSCSAAPMCKSQLAVPCATGCDQMDVASMLIQLDLANVVAAANTAWNSRVRDAWRTQFRDQYHLTEAEAFAILAFTVEAERSLYGVVGPLMNGGSPDETPESTLMSLLLGGISKLPVETFGEAYRGMIVKGSEGILHNAFSGESWNEGDIIKFNRFSSFSTSLKIAIALSGGPQVRGIVVTLHGGTFRRLGALSAMPEENELLEVPPTKYRIVERFFMDESVLMITVEPIYDERTALEQLIEDENDGRKTLVDESNAERHDFWADCYRAACQAAVSRFESQGHASHGSFNEGRDEPHPSSEWRSAGSIGASGLTLAVEKGSVKMCTMLLTGRVRADPNLQDERGLTPLNIAIAKRNLEMVKLLLGHGADANGKDKEGARPLMIAIADDQDDTVAVLIEHGADPNHTLRGK